MPTGMHVENKANLLLGAPDGAKVSYNCFGLPDRYYS